MAETIRVLQVSAGNVTSGGVESFVMNVYRHIDRTKVQFDFLTPSKTTFGNYKEEIEAMGGRIYELGIYYNKYTRLFQLLYKLPAFLKNSEYKYKIIHVHTGSITTEISMNLIEKLCGIPVRIAHSHSCGSETGIIFKLLQDISKRILKYCATDFFTCSEKAAHRLFTDKMIKENKVLIIKNGIDLERFAFNLKNREKLRTEFNVKDKFVIGHVGCFLSVKNHSFLLEVFSEILKYKDNAFLILVGDGIGKSLIEQKVKEKNLEDKVIFAGRRENVHEILSAFDAFVMPSLHEGLPVSLIECQTNGLQCFISDAITDEIKLTDLVFKKSLSESAKEWMKVILKETKPRKIEEGSFEPKLLEYDVNKTSKCLQDFYLNKHIKYENHLLHK